MAYNDINNKIKQEIQKASTSKKNCLQKKKVGKKNMGQNKECQFCDNHYNKLTYSGHIKPITIIGVGLTTV